jgi:hypothetical protein
MIRLAALPFPSDGSDPHVPKELRTVLSELEKWAIEVDPETGTGGIVGSRPFRW